jgi:hypothetical protein
MEIHGLSRCASVAALLLLVQGCDQFDKKRTSKEQPAFSVTSAGGTTYLVENQKGRVFAFSNGEFEEIPIVAASATAGKNGTRYYSDEAKNFTIGTSLKFFNGKLLYIVYVSPAWTAEYKNWFNQKTAALRANKAAPPAPEAKFKDPNWVSVAEKFGNLITVSLNDSDGFKIAELSLPLAGAGSAKRTSLVDADGVTKAMVRFEGSAALSGADFARIQATDITYVLD